MHGPAYDAQVAEVQRRGWIRAAVAAPFLVVSMAVGMLVFRSIGAHLDTSMYEPACRVSCRAVGSPTIGHVVGGRGHMGEVRCDCPDAKERSQAADLSNASWGDAILHHGGQELVSFALFASIALSGIVLGDRVGARPRG